MTSTEAENLELQFKTMNNSTAVGEFWIDEIYLMKDVSKADLSVQTSGTLKENETVGVSVVNPSGAKVKAFTVTAPDGTTVENNADGLSASFTAQYGQYTATITLVSGNQSDDTRNALYYGGKDTLIVRKIQIAEGAKTLTAEFGTHSVSNSGGDTVVTIPTYAFKKNGTAITPTSVDISVEMKYKSEITPTLNDNEFIAPYVGASYVVRYVVVYDGRTERFTYTATVARPETAEQHTIMDFDYASDLNDFYVDSNSSLTWLESFGYTQVAGDYGDDDIQVNGVVKVEYSGTTSPWFSFKPAHLMANYQAYDYIVFQIMCVSGASQINGIQPANGSNCENMGNGDNKSAWTYTSSGVYYYTYAFEISAFVNAWTDGDLDTATARVKLIASNAGAGTYYISHIYAAKRIEKSALDVTINGEDRANAVVSAGDVISLAMANPENYPYIDMTVKGPDNQEITSLSNITAVAGTYTVTFKHNTIGTTADDIAKYYYRHDYGGCHSKNGSTKTVTFTVA